MASPAAAPLPPHPLPRLTGQDSSPLPQVDLLVKAAVERRQNFSAPQQQVLQQWNAACKGQKIQRQQQAARDERSKDLTSYERKEKEWQSADITTSDGGGDLGGGIGNWLAKQNNN